jgi:hypothetical protein
MRSKEEILGRAFSEIPNMLRDYPITEIPSAMDEYAREVALAFCIFRDNFKRDELRKVKEEEKRLGGMITWVAATDEYIFNQFIQSIKQ